MNTLCLKITTGREGLKGEHGDYGSPGRPGPMGETADAEKGDRGVDGKNKINSIMKSIKYSSSVFSSKDFLAQLVHQVLPVRNVDLDDMELFYQ